MIKMEQPGRLIHFLEGCASLQVCRAASPDVRYCLAKAVLESKICTSHAVDLRLQDLPMLSKLDDFRSQVEDVLADGGPRDLTLDGLLESVAKAELER